MDMEAVQGKRIMAKNVWGSALYLAIPWTVAMIVTNSIIRGKLSADVIIANLIGGIFFWLFFTLFVKYFSSNVYKKISIDIANDEVILVEGGANHFRGKEGVGGKLVLTNKRLVFKSHKFNIQNHQQDFEVDKIINLKTFKSMFFLENGLILDFADGTSHKFIVDEAKVWMDMISNSTVTPKAI